MSEKTTYKLAFIGGGEDSIAGYPHLIASQLDGHFEVIAGVFSSNNTKNLASAKKYNIKNVYSNLEELVKNEQDNIDAIVILTPTPMHSETIEYLLEKNIPIICEKPLISSIKEVETLEDKYNVKNSFIAVINNYSGYAMVRELRNKIALNELGKIFQIRLKMSQESFLRPSTNILYPQKWRIHDDFIPTISLDLGIHLHHLSYFLLQKDPIKLSSTYDSFSEYDVIDNVNINFEYEDSSRGNIWLSKTALGNRNGLEIEVYGEKASAKWVQEKPEELAFSKINGEIILMDRGNIHSEIAREKRYNRMTTGHPSGFIESLGNLYSDIFYELDSFLQKKDTEKSPYVYGFTHAKDGIYFLHAASESNESRQWQRIKKDGI